MVYGLAERRYRLDWGASLSGGVTVFREAEPADWIGVSDVYRATAAASHSLEGSSVSVTSGAITVAGTIFTSHQNNRDAGVIAHERVHVLQFDFLVATLGDRTDTWALTKLSLSAVGRLLKVDLIPAALGAVNQALLSLSYHDSYPWEREANILSGHR